MSSGTGWIRRLAGFLYPHRRNVAIAFGAAMIGTTITVLTPLVERAIIDQVVVTQERPLAPLLALLLAAGVVRFFAAYVRRFVGGRVSLDVQHDIRRAVYEKLQRLDFASHDAMQTGQLVSRASSDVNLVQGLLAFLPIVTGNVLLFVLSLIVMLILSPLLTLVALAVGPLLLYVALKLRTSVFPAAWDSQQQAGVVAGVVDEAVAGVRVVKGFGQEQHELDKLTTASRRLFASRLRAVRIQAKYQPTLQAIPVLGQVAILALGGWLVIDGSISLGTFLAFSTYLAQLTSPTRMLAGLMAVGQQARAGVERIGDLLDALPAIVDKPDAIDLSVARGEVRFDDVRFGYSTTEPVLDGFRLTIAPGETVALVGTSGSGKSTTSLLLPRFYDVQGGAVRIDGVDVRDATIESVRRQIGVVFEDSFLFSDTIRANIAYGHSEATDEEVTAAAEAAEAHGFILALPDGYDTVVGEQGLTLSGGQRQRIALARALITDPHILLLDDATSAIDVRTEEEIHATLRRLMIGRTTLLVAHRRSTLRLADRICVVDHGRVVDDGTHEELMARSRLYRLLLAGPDDDAETLPPDGAIEGLDEHGDFLSGRRGDEALVDGITPSLWMRDETTSGAPLPHATVAAPAAAAVARGGFAGPGAAAMGAMAPTPELLAMVAALPPADDTPDVDERRAAAPEPQFRLSKVLRPFFAPLALAFVLVVLDAALTLAGPALVRFGIDHGVSVGATDVLLATAAVFLVIVVLDWIDSIAQALVSGRTAERLLFSLRIKIFAHLQRLGLDFYEREMAGRIMTRMTSDVDALATVFQTGLVTALVNIATFIGVGIALFVMNAELAAVTMLVLPPLIVTTLWFRNRSARAYDAAREQIANVNADLQESLSGVRVTQAFRREDRNEARFTDLSLGYRAARVRAQRLVSLYFPFVEFLSEVAAAIVLGVGAVMVGNGTTTAGVLIAFLLYLDQFFSPVQQLSQVFDSYQQARIALGRIDGLLRTPTSTPEPVSPAALPEGRLRGALTFDSVHFRYGPSAGEAIDGVQLEIAAGQTVAFVGQTGAGKSTLVKLVARFYDPTAGSVRVDGVDLRDLDLAGYRHHLGMVPQEPFLFSGTIRDNIAYGRPAASDAEVEGAARAAGAHDLVASLRGGYLHPVSERGRSLSAGQRQLVALARARLVDPAILLLDEATSQLDLAAEARVTRAMNAVAADRTTLLIAHRLPTARHADRIVVMGDGHVLESGTHDELIAREGPYAAAWAAFDDTRPVAGD